MKETAATSCSGRGSLHAVVRHSETLSVLERATSTLRRGRPRSPAPAAAGAKRRPTTRLRLLRAGPAFAATWLSLAARLATGAPLVDVAAEVGLTAASQAESFAPGVGAVVLDYDRDGRPDLFFPDTPCRLYRNEAAGPLGFTFRDVTREAGLEGRCSGLSATGFDYDRDGWIDLVVVDHHRVTLLHNEGGVFVDRTAAAGIGGEETPATVTAADFNGDGLADLFVGQYSPTFLRIPTPACPPGRLYVNQGDGTFREEAVARGLVSRGCTLAAAFLDLDGDGHLDLYIGNDGGGFNAPDQIFLGDGSGFTSAAERMGLRRAGYTMGVAAADLDGDGHLDLYLSNIGRNALLFGGPGAYRDAASERAVELPSVDEGEGRVRWRYTWGAAFIDLDQDGELDLFVNGGFLDNGVTPLWSSLEEPNVLFRGEAGSFSRDPTLAGDGRSSRGLVVADLNRDGVPDLLIVHGRIRGNPSGVPEPRPSLLLGERVSGHHALPVTLEGRVSEPRAAGAIVRASYGARSQALVVDPGGGSVGSQADARLIFGLGAETSARVSVRWPSGITTEHGPFPADAPVTLVEPEWLSAPAQARVGESVRIRLDPRWVGGVAAPVRFLTSAAGAVVSDTTRTAEGVAEATVVLPADPTAVELRVEVDGRLLHARRLIVVTDADRTTLVVPDSPPLVGSPSLVVVTPRDENGALRGPGRAVTVESGGGSLTASDAGDGTYRAMFTAGEAGTVFLGATVDGVPQDVSHELAVLPAVDAALSQLTPSPALLTPGSRFNLVVTLVDALGRPAKGSHGVLVEGLPDAPALQLEVRDGHGEQVATAPAAETDFQLTATVDGQPLTRSALLAVRVGGSPIPPALLDAARSGVSSFHTETWAGVGSARVIVEVRDVNGGVLPAAPGMTLALNGGSWRGGAVLGILGGDVPTRCFLAPAAPGVVHVRAEVGGVRLAREARIDVYPAPAEPVPDGCGADDLLDPFAVSDVRDPAPTQDGGATVDAGVDAGLDAGLDAGAPAIDDAGLTDGGSTRPPPSGGCQASGGHPAQGAWLLLLALLGLRVRLTRRGRAASRGVGDAQPLIAPFAAPPVARNAPGVEPSAQAILPIKKTVKL